VYKSRLGKMKKATIVMMLGILVSCASPQYNYVPESIDVSEPPIGEVNVANVGDILVRQGTYTEQEAIHLQEDFSVGLVGSYEFKSGYYLKVGEDKETEFYEPEIGPYGGRVIKGALADPYQSMQVYKGKNKICGVSAFGGRACEDGVKFSRTKRPAITANSFQQALIYSGRIGEKINIGYREYSNNTARPAFNNDVEYDLGTSRTIGYKGSEIEIIEATNQIIKYRVLRNFNASQ
jgi:hypothetical protein